MAPLSKHSASARDLALTVWLEELVTGRRVLWVGDPNTGAADRLASFAHSVRVLDTSGRGRSRERGAARVSPYRSIADLSGDAGRYDLAVVPDVSVFEDFAAAAAQLSESLGDGMLLAGCDVGEEPDRAYGELSGQLRGAFREVRMLAEGGFRATGLVDLEARGTDVVVDGSLLGEDTEPIRRFLALAADEVPPIAPHMLVQVPDGASPTAASESAPSAERQIAALRTELERSVSRLEQAQTRLIATESDLAEARSALGKGAQPEQERDIDRLESHLRERGATIRELEAELERRATLVRDITEELREARRHRGSAAGDGDGLERALDAEAARDEARFRADELETRVAARDRELAEVLEAQAAFEGRVRGYRSRVAELEEMGEMGSARIRLLELDLSEARETIRELEGGLAETREEVELAMIKARGAPGQGTRQSELQSELEEARESLVEATEARDRARAETLGLTAQVALAESRIEGLRLGYEMRIAMLGGEQSSADQGPDESTRRELSELRGARAGLRLRVADLEASLAPRLAAGSAADADTLRADVDVLRADNGELTLRLADVEQARAEAAQRAADLSSALAARDALVTRLQLDLAQEEQASRHHDHQLRRMQEENERLREGVLAATEAVTAQEAAEAQMVQLREALAKAEAEAAGGDSEALAALREEAALASKQLAEARAEAEEARATIAALEKRQTEAGAERSREHATELKKLHDDLAARRAEAERVSELQAAMEESQAQQARQSGLLQDSVHALRQTRTLLDGLRAEREGERLPRSEITAVGTSAPEVPERQLERELADKETLLRSLTAQLEERDDRLRALERRLAESPSGKEGGDVEGELLELEERVARLQEELHHERDARSAAEQELESLSRRPDTDAELEKARAQLQTREAALDVARSRARAAAKDVESLREVCADTRHGLEELLGAATSAGDPATAERIGALLSVLSRY